MENILMKVSDHPLDKKITLLKVTGHIDSLTAPEFSKRFLSVLEEEKFRLVVDLSGVDYIGSAGWGVFISEIKRIRAHQGDILLAGMREEVFDVFILLEFDTFMSSYPNVEMAVQNGFQRPHTPDRTGVFSQKG
jgi:anti-anti-sigma factor